MNYFPALHRILKYALSPMAARFNRELGAPQAAQQKLLAHMTRQIAATEYGQSVRLKADDHYPAFAAKVPLVNYDDISRWIELQKKHQRPIIAAEHVLFYEKTSGSSGAAKHIPCTRGLKKSFHRMFLIWLADLLRHAPPMKTGKVFLSISPNFRTNEVAADGTKIGLDDDTEYLASWSRMLLKPFLVAPAALTQLQSPRHFKHVLSLYLLAAADLEVISIWNPSLLTILLDHIQAHREQLCHDLKKGVVTAEGVCFRFPSVAGQRLKLLQATDLSWSRLWPHLKLISCWDSAQARSAAQGLAALFPNVFLQGKGLLATEAPMTLPIISAGGFVPLPSEVFYEFLTDEGRISLLHELTVGNEYEIVITQKGGLSRYRIGDRVRVTHFYKATPCLEFIGRNDDVCDLVGEKLNEIFVRDCLAQMNFPAGSFQLLVPIKRARQYILLVGQPPDDCGRLESEMDRLLCSSYHYRNARLLGQLHAARVVVRENLRAEYYDFWQARGLKWGDIKQQALLKSPDDAALLVAQS